MPRLSPSASFTPPRRRLLRWVGLFWLAGPAVALAAYQATTLGGVDVDVWWPDAAAPQPWPVIVFSHGYRGCATQSRFLAEAFAAAGYLVVAPNHRDASCRRGARDSVATPRVPFGDPAAWTEASYRDRAEDVRRVVAALDTDERLRGRVDRSRLGLAGHSLGGYTVLGLAGAWPEWKLSGVKAVLALSPYSQPFLVHHTLGGLAAPVMYQGGTRDPGTTPALQRAEGAFVQSPAPKYFVEFDGAGHFAWTNLGVGHRDAIVTYSVAFLNHYVSGDAGSSALMRKLPGVAALRYAAE